MQSVAVAESGSANSTRGFASLASAWRGQVRIADDFDELPDDLADALDMQS